MKILNVFLAATIITALTLTSKLNAETDKNEKAVVTSVMRANFEALTNLQPYIADEKKFQDPKNSAEIQKNLDILANFKHVFPKGSLDREPGFAAIASLFGEYLQDVQRAFKEGGRGTFVRNQVKTITGFCMNCHTRVGSEKSFEDLGKRVDTLTLSKFQRAEFYAATRQFDKALAALDELISNSPEGEFALLEFARAIRQVLSITVRVKQDPNLTSAFLDKIDKRKDVPDYFKRYVASWKKSVASWKQERSTGGKLSAESHMAKARLLVQQASKEQLFAVDPTGDVSFLRATNHIHEALQKSPQGKFRGEALYLLGVSYDALKDPLLWALDSMYFETCVREFPHTEISKKCYKRYATKLYFDYSGSGGTFVPEDELEKLGKLRKLSE